MSFSREELLRQKALVEEQLRWIDAKLAETGQAPSSTALPPSAAQPSLQPQEVTSPAPAMASTSVSGMEFASNGPSEGITSAQKIGCFILVVLVCAGVLAALFVLPYLLY